MFKYKNKKGIMCIVDTSTNKEYRLSMPHEVVEVVAILNAAEQRMKADADLLSGRVPEENEAVTEFRLALGL